MHACHSCTCARSQPFTYLRHIQCLVSHQRDRRVGLRDDAPSVLGQYDAVERVLVLAVNQVPAHLRVEVSCLELADTVHRRRSNHNGSRVVAIAWLVLAVPDALPGVGFSTFAIGVSVVVSKFEKVDLVLFLNFGELLSRGAARGQIAIVEIRSIVRPVQISIAVKHKVVRVAVAVGKDPNPKARNHVAIVWSVVRYVPVKIRTC